MEHARRLDVRSLSNTDRILTHTADPPCMVDWSLFNSCGSPEVRLRPSQIHSQAQPTHLHTSHRLEPVDGCTELLLTLVAQNHTTRAGPVNKLLARDAKLEANSRWNGHLLRQTHTRDCQQMLSLDHTNAAQHSGMALHTDITSNKALLRHVGLISALHANIYRMSAANACKYVFLACVHSCDSHLHGRAPPNIVRPGMCAAHDAHHLAAVLHTAGEDSETVQRGTGWHNTWTRPIA